MFILDSIAMITVDSPTYGIIEVSIFHFRFIFTSFLFVRAIGCKFCSYIPGNDGSLGVFFHSKQYLAICHPQGYASHTSSLAKGILFGNFFCLDNGMFFGNFGQR